MQEWLDTMDQRVMVHQLRHLLQMTTLNASESGLQGADRPASAQSRPKHISTATKSTFCWCSISHCAHRRRFITSGSTWLMSRRSWGRYWAKWSPPLGVVRATGGDDRALHGFRSLRDILKTNFIEQGRRVKESAGGMFYDSVRAAGVHTLQFPAAPHTHRADACRPDLPFAAV